jgi:hypothetical protein
MVDFCPRSKALNFRHAVLIMALSALITPLDAQGQDTLKGRLAPVPVDAKSRPTTGGFGSVTATLVGTKLTVNGTFTEFASPATLGQLHLSRTIGVRGPVAFDLNITKGATNGTVSGTFDLNAQQAEAARKGLLYVQIHAEKAPEGNVWGWLLK